MKWEFHDLRVDGDRVCNHELVHESGRILARIKGPTTNDEYLYDVFFRCKVPEHIIADDDYNFEFMTLESAQFFVAEILSKFDPFAPPVKKEKEDEA